MTKAVVERPLETLIVFCMGLTLTITLLAKQQLKTQIRMETMGAQTQELIFRSKLQNDLLTYQGLAVYEKLSELDKYRIHKAVKFYCDVEYHAPSCVHHLIMCGKACHSSLTKVSRNKVFRDYHLMLNAVVRDPATDDQ